VDGKPDYLLAAERITKSFSGVPALRNGALKLSPGSVHALCGGNGAGKSTFLNIVMGLIPRDSGEISINGQAVNFASPAEAIQAGISIITQELTPIPGLTVAENIYLGREPMRLGLAINYDALFKKAQVFLASLRFPVNPRSLMSELSLAHTQLVEIAKAISHDSHILIMDEPTSAIGESETEILFDAIRNLKKRGVGIIYVTHRLTEVFQIADDYTVFRDGAFVETGKVAAIDRKKLVELIVGYNVVKSSRLESSHKKEPMLEVSGFSQAPKFKDVNFQVGKGEILGIYGLMGSGRSELLNAIYGLTRADSGSLRLNGKKLVNDTPGTSIDNGFALITEDRKSTGLALCRPIRENISISSLKAISLFGMVRGKSERLGVNQVSQRFKIRLASTEMPVQQLSGGNQQKVVLARCLLTNPIVLLCDEPTRGIDEGTKQEIYSFLSEFTQKGNCAIVVSSELDEILQVSDRILVFKQGKIVAEVSGSDATQQNLVHLAS
jgi:ABC-type sugar transport system ATPase subunit